MIQGKVDFKVFKDDFENLKFEFRHISNTFCKVEKEKVCVLPHCHTLSMAPSPPVFVQPHIYIPAQEPPPKNFSGGVFRDSTQKVFWGDI